MPTELRELLDLAVGPDVGAVNFFHMRNLLFTFIEALGIGDIEAQEAVFTGPNRVEDSRQSGQTVDSDSESGDADDEDEETISDQEPEYEEVTQTIVDEDGQEKTVVVKVEKPKDPSVKKKEKEEKKAAKKLRGESRGKDKGSKESKHSKSKDSKETKTYKTIIDKDGKEVKVEVEKPSSKSSAVKPRKPFILNSENLADSKDFINLKKRVEGAEIAIVGLRTVLDNMVNQVDFGDEVGEMLKSQLDQVQIELPPPEPRRGKSGQESGLPDEAESGIGSIVSVDQQDAAVRRGQNIPLVVGGADGAGIIPGGRAPDGSAVELNADGTRSVSRQSLRQGGKPGAKVPAKKGKVSFGLKKKTATSDVGDEAELDEEEEESGEETPRKPMTLRDLQMRRKARMKKDKKKKKKSKGEDGEEKKDDEKDESEDDDEDEDEDEDSDEDDEPVDPAEVQAAMDQMVLDEIEAALQNPEDTESQFYALRLGLEQMANIRKNMTQQQDEFKKQLTKNQSAIDEIRRELSAFYSARQAKDAESFNAVHHVHSMVLELQVKHEKVVSTTQELIREYNRREKDIETLYKMADSLDERKADKFKVENEIKLKASRDDLEGRVTLGQFDESFTILDQGLNDALMRMDNQMTLEEALKLTMEDLQNKLNVKLDRDELYSIRDKLEAKIKEVQETRAVVTVKEEDDADQPAGFKRPVEKVKCISCDRPLDVNQNETGPSLPKPSGFPASKSNKPHTTYELDYIRYQKLQGFKSNENRQQRNKMYAKELTGGVDQRQCGGSHTMIHPAMRNFKSTMTHFNQFVIIRDESDGVVSLPKRDFLVNLPKDVRVKQLMKEKLPRINSRENRPMSAQKERPIMQSARSPSAPTSPRLGSPIPTQATFGTTTLDPIEVPQADLHEFGTSEVYVNPHSELSQSDENQSHVSFT